MDSFSYSYPSYYSNSPSIDPRYLAPSPPSGSSASPYIPSGAGQAYYPIDFPNPEPSLFYPPWPQDSGSPQTTTASTSSCESSFYHESLFPSNDPPLKAARRSSTTRKSTYAARAGRTLSDLSDYPAHIKPDYSVKVLCEHAIRGSKRGKMTLAEIVDAIVARFPYYGDAENMRKLKASARHDLSLDARFHKVKRGFLEPGRGTFWANGPAPLDDAENSSPPAYPSVPLTSRGVKVEQSVTPPTPFQPLAHHHSARPRSSSVFSHANPPYALTSDITTFTFSQHGTLPNPPPQSRPLIPSYQSTPSSYQGQEASYTHRYQPYARRPSVQ